MGSTLLRLTWLIFKTWSRLWAKMGKNLLWMGYMRQRVFFERETKEWCRLLAPQVDNYIQLFKQLAVWFKILEQKFSSITWILVWNRLKSFLLIRQLAVLPFAVRSTKSSSSNWLPNSKRPRNPHLLIWSLGSSCEGDYSISAFEISLQMPRVIILVVFNVCEWWFGK